MPLLLPLVLLACAPPPYDPPDTGSGGGADTAPTGPQLDLVWPANETEVDSCVYVVVDWSGFTLTDPMVSPEPVDGQAHYHVLVDDVYRTLCNAPYCLVDFDETTSTESGWHRLTVQLNDNAHAPVVDDEGNEIRDEIQVNVTNLAECTQGAPVEY